MEARVDWSTKPRGKEVLYRRGLVSRHKAGDFEAQNWEVFRYFVYLNTGLLERQRENNSLM